jgi:hypothetical protein
MFSALTLAFKALAALCTSPLPCTLGSSPIRDVLAPAPSGSVPSFQVFTLMPNLLETTPCPSLAVLLTYPIWALSLPSDPEILSSAANTGFSSHAEFSPF